MPDLKTSQFPYTNDLSGNEYVGVVQGGVNYQTTVDAFNARINDQLNVRIGHHSYAANPSSYAVAIGYNATAETNASMAIGYRARGWSNGTLAIGYDAYAGTSWSTAIGFRAYAVGESSIAIGHGAKTYNNTSTAIGWYSQTQASYSQLFGYNNYAGPNASHSVALGSRASVKSIRSIAIGHNVEVNTSCDYGIAIGERAYIGQLMSPGTCANNIVIGNQARASNSYNVVIGYQTNRYSYPAVSRTTVVGSKAYSTNSYGVAVGYGAAATGFYAVAIGAYAQANSEGVAIGLCYAGQCASSIGWQSQATGFNSVAMAGGQTNNSYSVSIGRYANDWCIGSSVTRGHGITGMPVTPTDHVQRFYGITTSDNQTVVLTADGNAPNETANVPALYRGAVARLTGTVVGYADTGFSSHASDTAAFVLDPLLLVRYADDYSYQLVGTPTFTLENSTAGASGWDVPTLTYDSETDALLITVNNDASYIMWMGFMRFEASQ